MANRFEQVDAPRADEITVTLWKADDGATYGQVHVPPRVEGGEIVAPVMLQERVKVPAALNAAIDQAHKREMRIVIVDPDDLWESAWGELYRP